MSHEVIACLCLGALGFMVLLGYTRIFGSIVIFVGLCLLGLGCWMGWMGWVRVARWPRTTATLVSKSSIGLGSRLAFQYEIGGHAFTGFTYRWGSEKALRTTLESYRPGSTHEISYNPANVWEIESTLSYDWELLRAPISAAIVSVLMIFVGIWFYRLQPESTVTAKAERD